MFPVFIYLTGLGRAIKIPPLKAEASSMPGTNLGEEQNGDLEGEEGRKGVGELC